MKQMIEIQYHISARSLYKVAITIYSKTHSKNLSLQEVNALIKQRTTITDIDQEILKAISRLKQLKGEDSFYVEQNVSDFLKECASTGNLFAKNTRLICNFFTPIPIEYHFTKEENGTNYNCSAFLLWRDKKIPFCKADMYLKCTPAFVLIGNNLRCFPADLSWQHISPLIDKPSILLQKTECYDWMADLREVKGVSLVSAKEIQNEPTNAIPKTFPKLILCDRSGATANLRIVYEGIGEVFYHDHLTKTGFTRYLEQEKMWEKDLLETDFIRKQVGNSHYFCPSDRLANTLSFLLELGWEIIDFRGNKVHLAQQQNLHFQEKNGEIQIKAAVKYDDYEANLKDLQGSFSRKERFISLSLGHVGLFPEGWNQSFIGDLEGATEGEKGSFVVKKSKFLSFNTVPKEINLHEDPAVAQFRKDSLEAYSEYATQGISNAFSDILRPYQQEGVQWLLFLKKYGFNGILADDMGLGKTIQILAFLDSCKNSKQNLIVVPTSLLFNWKNEIQRFLPQTDFLIYHGANRRALQDSLHSKRWILTSYAIVRQDIDVFQKMEYEHLILDEAHVIKNHETLIAQALRKIKATFKLSVTGTPIENSIGELWSHFLFLMPELLGSQVEFASQVAAGRQDFRYMEQIKRKIKPFILRRTKEQVAKDLPEKIIQNVFIDFDVEQHSVYESFLKQARNSEKPLDILEKILRLRQACCHTLLVNPEISSSAKLVQILSDIRDIRATGAKVLVFSQFKGFLKLIAKSLIEEEFVYCYLDGETRNREAVVKQFQQDPNTGIFLISLKAGGVGLNLTAAEYVLICDPWWHEATEQQAIDRAHRIGQKNTVFAKRYIMANSIEEKILLMKERKLEVKDSVLNDEEFDEPKFSVADLKALLD